MQIQRNRIKIRSLHLLRLFQYRCIGEDDFTPSIIKNLCSIRGGSMCVEINKVYLIKHLRKHLLLRYWSVYHLLELGVT